MMVMLSTHQGSHNQPDSVAKDCGYVQTKASVSTFPSLISISNAVLQERPATAG